MWRQHLGCLGRTGGDVARALAQRALARPRRPEWTASTECLAAALRETLRRAPEAGVGWLRAWLALAPPSRAVLRRVRVETVRAGSVAAEWFLPEAGATRDGAVLYLHGGGYVLPVSAVHREYAARLAFATGARVLLPDYRVAPEDPFPAAYDDAVAAARWLLAEAVPAERLAFAGDSAGGALCVTTLLALRDEGVRPAGALLVSPWVDPFAETGSMVTHRERDVGDARFLLWCARQYAPPAAARDPRVAPVAADLAGLPPLAVHLGTAEVLSDQVCALVSRARAAGVPVTLHEYDDMFHGFQSFPDWMAPAARALDEGARFLMACLDGSLGSPHGRGGAR